MKKLYVRFEKTGKEQTGLLLGPYKNLKVTNTEIRAFSSKKKSNILVCSYSNQTWLVPEFNEYYNDFTVEMG